MGAKSAARTKKSNTIAHHQRESCRRAFGDAVNLVPTMILHLQMTLFMFIIGSRFIEPNSWVEDDIAHVNQ